MCVWGGLFLETIPEDGNGAGKLDKKPKANGDPEQSCGEVWVTAIQRLALDCLQDRLVQPEALTFSLDLKKILKCS